MSGSVALMDVLRGGLTGEHWTCSNPTAPGCDASSPSASLVGGGARVGVFSRGRRAAIFAYVGGRLHGAGAPGEVWGAAREVILQTYVVEGTAEDERRIRRDVRWASAIYEGNRTGIAFSVGSPRRVTDPSVVGRRCPPPGGLTNSGYYRPGHINVYFVPWIGDEPPSDVSGERKGETCYAAEGPSHPEVIYISLTYPDSSTLAHELGHSMGMRTGVAHVGIGSLESPLIPGFTSSNVMWSNPPRGVLQDHISLGQAYRMNVHAQSWLNESGARGGLYQAPCGSSAALADPCPCLALDPP